MSAMMVDVGRFLSADWLSDLAAAAAASEPLRQAAQGMRLTVRHVVDDVEYRMRFGDGCIEVLAGTGEADVDVYQSYQTAAAISRGELAPADAFASGLLRLGGRPGLLAEHREALSRLGDVFADVRARTTY
jgi:putative sterol carrier protein